MEELGFWNEEPSRDEASILWQVLGAQQSLPQWIKPELISR